MATYYISTSGSTSNNGTTSSTPWPISKFTSFAFVAGDNILFKKGDSFLGVNTFSKSGISGNPIIIDAYGSGNNPELNGNGANTPALFLNNCNYITIRNIVVKNCSLSAEAPFYVSGGGNFEIYNCFAGFGKRGMNFINCTGAIHISYCFFSDFKSPNSTNTALANGGGSGIQLNNCSGANTIIEYNKFYTPIGTGSNPNPGVGDIISQYKCYFSSSSPSEVRFNKVRGGGSDPAGYAGAVGGDVGGSYQNIHDNWFINAGKVGAQVQGGTFINMSNNIIYGKTFPYTSVGLAFGNYSNLACNNITMGGNKINFYSGSNSRVFNKWWDSGAKTFPAFQPTNWSTNTADSTGDTTITDALIPDPLFLYGDWNTSTSSLVFPSISTKTYGTTNFDPGATSSNSITYISSNTSVATIVSGNIHIVGVGSSTITANDGVTSISQTLNVSKASLTITGNNASKVYGTTNPSLSISYSGFVNGENASNLISLPTVSTSATLNSVVGTYSIVPVGAISNNYNFTYVNGVLTVTKASLTIIADSKSKTFNTANPSLTASYVGFISGDSSSSLTTQPTLSTTAITSSPVGVYVIAVGGAVTPNYNITYTTGILTIGSVSITFNSIANKAYGTSDFNPGATSAASITYTSSNTSVATIVSGNIHIIGVGTSTITADNGSSTATQVLTVTSINLTVTADNYIISVGDNMPTLTATYSGFVNGDTTSNITIPSITTTGTNVSPIGTYPITISGGVSNNYNFIYIGAFLSIIGDGFINIHKKIRFV